MEKLKINNISKNFFRTSSINKVESNQSNPFGVSFKGNILKADVFETAASKTNLISRASNKINKLKEAVLVSSINDAISTRLDSIVSFGRRIKSNVTNLRDQVSQGWNRADAWWENVKNREITDIVRSGMSKLRNENSVDNLLRMPVQNIEEMWTAELAMIK